MNSRSINFFYVEDFEGSGEQLIIEVCAELTGVTEDVADFMLVSVGFGKSMCPPPTSTPSPALVAAITAPTNSMARGPTSQPSTPTDSPEFLPIAGRPGTSQSLDFPRKPVSVQGDFSESVFGEVVGNSAIDSSGVYRASALSLAIAFVLTISLAPLA
jgi:hypothetical protein